MKRGWVVLLAVALALITIFSAHAFTTAQQLGVTNNKISRIADFSHNGFYDVLAFSDRLDTTAREIQLYKQHNTSFYLAQTINSTKFKQCSMSYQDANKNGKLELFFACKDEQSQLQIKIYEFNGTQYNFQQDFQTQNTFTTNGFGDTLFFDFTGNGYADILSCYMGNQTHLSIQINQGTATNGITDYQEIHTTIQTTQFSQSQTSTTMSQCYLVAADVDGDGDFDIIAYTYDGTQIAIYENTFCDVSGCKDIVEFDENVFVPLDPNDYFDTTISQTNKIKNLRAFDENQDGFSDLYYIIETEQQSSNKTIEFGFFPNQRRNSNHEVTLTTPQIKNITFVHDDPNTINFSWKEYENKGNYYIIEIEPSQIQINGTNIVTNQNIFYNINFSHSEYEFGDFFESNYDYNAGYGNLLYRTNANISLPFLNYTVTVQAIAPSGKKSAISNPVVVNTTYAFNDTYAFPLEFCDGFANTNPSKRDAPFTITFPNGETARVNFDADNDGYYAAQYFVRSPSNASQNVTINCAERFLFLNQTADPNDADPCNPIACQTQNTNTQTAPTISAGTGPTTVAANVPPGNENNQRPEPITPQPETPTETPTQPQTSSSESSLASHTATTREFESRYQLEYRNGKTYITESIKKIRRGDVATLDLVKTFPKEILTGASLLDSLTPFTIIRENPIVQFEVQNWNYLEDKVFTYAIPGQLNLAQVNQIQSEYLNIVYKDDIDKVIQELDRQAQVANQSIVTQIEERVVDNQTQIILRIDLADDAQKVSDVEVEQYIPKCLIAEINDLILSTGVNREFIDNVQIKEADPIIVWNFKEVTHGQEIVFTLPTLRDEDCDDEIKIQTLAKEFIRKNYEVDRHNVFLALVFTTGIVLFFLALFFITTRETEHEHPHIHKLSKIIIRRFHAGETIEQIKQTLVHESKEDIEEAAKHAVNSRGYHNKWFHHFSERSVEIFIFLILLILNVSEFMGHEYAIMSWTKKLISWLLILVILHRADMTKLLFNNSQKFVNWLLIIGMFLMHSKILVSFSHTQLFNQNLELTTQWFGFSSNIIFDLYAWISNNSIYFTYYAFIAGAILVAIAALRIAFVEIKQGCVYFLLTRHPIAHTLVQKIKRTLKVYFLFMLFFFAVFNKMLEWLAIAIDTFIFLATIIFLLGIIFSTKLYHKQDKRHHSIFSSVANIISHNYLLTLGVAFGIYLFIKPFTPYYTQIGFTLIAAILITALIVVVLEVKNKFGQLKHLTTAVDSIYLKTLKLFEYPGTIFIAIGGLIVLQSIVELCLFIVPQVLGSETSIYATSSHITLLSLFSNTTIISIHLFGMSLADKVVYALAYAITLFGFFAIFFIPVLLWTVYFKHRHIPPTKINLEIHTQEHNTLTKIINACNYIAVPSMIIALLSQVITLKPILELAESQDIGVLFTAQQTLFTQNDILIAIIGLLLYIVAVRYLPKKYTLNTMFLLSIAFFILIYATAFIQSISHYILTTYALTQPKFESLIMYIILAFIALDTILVYGFGLSILLYFTLPQKVKQTITVYLTKHHIFGRYFYLTNDMHHLEYYESAKHTYANNLMHHLEQYVTHEEKQGHSIETIIMQLKLHDYPDELIDEAIKDLLADPKFVHELEHLKAIHIDPKRIKQLVPQIHRELKRKATSNEIFQIYLADYSYAEIKLAIRYATSQTKGTISLAQIETDELKLLLDVIEHVHTVENWPVDKIETELVQRGYNPTFVFILAQSPTFKSHNLNLTNAFNLYSELEKWKTQATDASDLYKLVSTYTYKETTLALEAVLEEYGSKHAQLFEVHKFVQENPQGQAHLASKGYPPIFIQFAREHPYSKESAKFLEKAIKHM
jgi:hypothetical protein